MVNDPSPSVNPSVHPWIHLWLFPREEAARLQLILGDVLAEIAAQEKTWGRDRVLGGRTWLAILTEEVGEVAQASLAVGRAGFRDELIQVAAVAIAALEQEARAGIDVRSSGTVEGRDDAEVG